MEAIDGTECTSSRSPAGVIPGDADASPIDPAACVPVPAGSHVRRVAGTPHNDGVIRSHPEPAIIAICGIGPVNYKLIDPPNPG